MIGLHARSRLKSNMRQHVKLKGFRSLVDYLMSISFSLSFFHSLSSPHFSSHSFQLIQYPPGSPWYFDQSVNNSSLYHSHQRCVLMCQHQFLHIPLVVGPGEVLAESAHQGLHRTARAGASLVLVHFNGNGHHRVDSLLTELD